MSLRLVEESKHSKVTIGHAGLAIRQGETASVPAAVHDGDTVSARALANISIRFLGVDTAEVTFPLPGERAFRNTGSPEWEEFLSDPFATWHDATAALGPSLRAELEARTGPGAATNHRKHAEEARARLQTLIQSDIDRFAGSNSNRFTFFLRYARDVIDRYGRLLAYINVNVEDPKTAPARTYNERMLALGFASPYFIWPNLDPFKQQLNMFDAVPVPENLAAVARAGRLGESRRSVDHAREQGLGIFGGELLRIQPFELRFLSQRRAPDRWVVDLSKNDGVLLRPVDYHRIPKLEDRLYVPAEYVSLFELKGWARAE